MGIVTVKREVQCAKETVELLEGLSGLLKDVKLALADGWQPATDIPVMLTAAMARLGTAVDGVSKVKDEYADKQAFINAILVPVSEMVGELLG